MDGEHDNCTPVAILFDVDGCLISTGGAGTRSWRRAFEALYGIPADIGDFTEAGMTDPEVGRLTFSRVIGRDPTDREMARLLGAYLEGLEEDLSVSEDTACKVIITPYTFQSPGMSRVVWASCFPALARRESATGHPLGPG